MNCPNTSETLTLLNQPADTPMKPKRRDSVEVESPPTNKDKYQRQVGKLIYVTHTRPDIGFAVSMASRYMTNATKNHMMAVNRILQYLKRDTG